MGLSGLNPNEFPEDFKRVLEEVLAPCLCTQRLQDCGRTATLLFLRPAPTDRCLDESWESRLARKRESRVRFMPGIKLVLLAKTSI